MILVAVNQLIAIFIAVFLGIGVTLVIAWMQSRKERDDNENN